MWRDRSLETSNGWKKAFWVAIVAGVLSNAYWMLRLGTCQYAVHMKTQDLGSAQADLDVLSSVLPQIGGADSIEHFREALELSGRKPDPGPTTAALYFLEVQCQFQVHDIKM